MIDSKNVDLYYDYLDQACLIIYDELGINYLDCLIRVGNDILEGINESGLSPETVAKLDEVYNHLVEHSFLDEEIRLAMQLLIVKAFKHNSTFPLDLMTPDSISFLFAFIIGMYFSENHENLLIAEIGLGTGNLINAICNFLESQSEEYYPKLIGIEHEQRLAELAKVNTDLQGNEIQILLNDALSPNYITADAIVGDLDSKIVEGKYFPYLIINYYLNHLNDGGIFIYLIANDFFNQVGVNEFRKEFTGTLLGLIVLPESIFKDNVIGKSLLIGTNKEINNYEMLVMNLLSIVDKDIMEKHIGDITDWILNLKGMLN